MTENRYVKAGFASFEEMYRSEHPFVYKIVFFMVKDKTIAEDLTQDVFMRITEKIAQRYSPQNQKSKIDSFRSWSSVVTRNLVNSYFNRKRLEQEYIKDLTLETNDPSNLEKTTVEELVLEKEELEGVLIAIDAIANAKRRETVRLRVLEDCSYREISDELEMPIGTVMSGLSRAKEEMRAYLTDE